MRSEPSRLWVCEMRLPSFETLNPLLKELGSGRGIVKKQQSPPAVKGGRALVLVWNVNANLPGPLQRLHAARTRNAAQVKLSTWFAVP